MKREIILIEGWHSLTVLKLQRLYPILSNLNLPRLEQIDLAICALYDVTMEELDATDLVTYRELKASVIPIFTGEMKVPAYLKRICIGGKWYEVDLSLKRISFAFEKDLVNAKNQGEAEIIATLHETLSGILKPVRRLFRVPIGEKVLEQWIIRRKQSREQIANAVLQAKAVEVLSILNYFQTSFLLVYDMMATKHRDVLINNLVLQGRTHLEAEQILDTMATNLNRLSTLKTTTNDGK